MEVAVLFTTDEVDWLWFIQICCCPDVFAVGAPEDDELEPALSICCATPFVGRATAGAAAAVVITPPDTLSTVVPGLESWDEAGTDFRDPSDIFISDVCPLGAACVNKAVFCPVITFNACPCVEDVPTPTLP